MADPRAQIEMQAETIKKHWVEIAKLKARVDAQQYIINKQECEIAELSRQATPQAQAEKAFK